VVGNNEVPEGRVVDENKTIRLDQRLKPRAIVGVRIYSSGKGRGTEGHCRNDKTRPSHGCLLDGLVSAYIPAMNPGAPSDKDVVVLTAYARQKFAEDAIR
jgi:hypothetical protein